MNNVNKPFTRSFVLRATAKHLEASINTSLAKTVARIGEFEGNIEKSTEVFQTISALSSFKKLIEEFQLNNPALFKE